MSQVQVRNIEGMTAGAKVDLLRDDGEAIGRGHVRHVGENETCHFVRLGNGRLSVEVSKTLHPSHALPYPTEEFGTIADAINSVVLWDCSWVRLKNCCDMFSDPVQTDGMPGVQNDNSNQVLFKANIVSYEDISAPDCPESTPTGSRISSDLDHPDPL